MERIQIETTQNVSLEYEIANIGERILAQVLDLIVLFIYFFIVLIIVAGIFHSANDNLMYVLYIIFYLPVIFYSFLCELIFDGQTLGKYILKLKVLRLDGSRPNILNYLIRWVMRLVDVWLFSGSIGVITVIANGKGQRLGDIAAGTSVIKLKKRTLFDNSIYRFLPKEYIIVYPQVNLLNDYDINTINEVLKAYVKTPNESAVKLLKETVEKVKNKTGIQFVQNPSEQKSSEPHPYIFLDTLIKDYNCLNQEKASI
jgi:uncharacterized RDD family membrane protein YckC